LKATRRAGQELVERRAQARRSMRESDEDEVRRFYRDMLAGIRRMADMLERMADFKSVITESVDGWGQDGDSKGEKTGSGMD